MTVQDAAISTPKKSHLWARDPHDYYTEEKWCSERLFERVRFIGQVWDPACGSGRIVASARAAGLDAFGTDIVVRSPSCRAGFDFLASTPNDNVDCIVTNPPFKHAEAFVRTALPLVRNKAAFLLPVAWLNGSKRSLWLEDQPLSTVAILTPRPSMPPGAVVEAGGKVGGGTTDFAWFIFDRRHTGRPEIVWLRK